MKEKKISIKEICGDYRISREDGAKLRRAILQSWNECERVIIDFDNLSIASASFLDEGIAKLGLDFSAKEISDKIKLENIRPFDKSLLNDLILSRLNRDKEETELKKYLAEKRRKAAESGM